MNFHQISQYLKYFVFSGHRKGQGIHSPLVYNLVSKVFRNKIPTDIVCKIEMIRESLLKDDRVIVINDLGAGQRRNIKQRKVSDKVKFSAVNKKYGRFLFNLASEFGQSSILELGTSFGISTMYLASACKDSTVYTIEGCPGCASIAGENFSKAGLTNIVQFTGSFDSMIPEIISEKITPGLIFIDGNHRKDPTLRYFFNLTEALKNQVVFVIDDIHNSKEMSEAWEAIKNMDNVTATIDIFRMGIAFVGSSMTPNHYIIRY